MELGLPWAVPVIRATRAWMPATMGSAKEVPTAPDQALGDAGAGGTAVARCGAVAEDVVVAPDAVGGESETSGRSRTPSVDCRAPAC